MEVCKLSIFKLLEYFVVIHKVTKLGRERKYPVTARGPLYPDTSAGDYYGITH